MSFVYIMGDMHLGQTDKQIKRWWPIWDSAAEHDHYILTQWRKTVTKNDLVWVLGDIGPSKAMLPVIADLPGRKKMLHGNHDEFKTWEYLLYGGFESVEGMVPYKQAWLTHCPIHPGEMRKKTLNIHGHTHGGGPEGPYYNTCAEFIDFTPIKYTTIMEKYNALQHNA